MAFTKTILVAISASVAAALPAPAANASTPTVLAWPSMIPGHGTLQINMSAVASDTRSTDLISLIDDKLIPSTFVISKDGGDEPCDNPLLYTYADAVNGTLCLGGHEQEPGVLVMSSPLEILGNLTGTGNTSTDAAMSPANTDGWCNPQTSCICKCGLACMASLLLYPLCLAACMACPN